MRSFERGRFVHWPPTPGFPLDSENSWRPREPVRRAGKDSMTKRWTLIRVGVLWAGVLMACPVIKAQDVRCNFMPGTDFSKYHTYKWVSIEGEAHPSQIVDGEIKQAIDTQLASKGLTKTTGDTADLYVA